MADDSETTGAYRIEFVVEGVTEKQANEIAREARLAPMKFRYAVRANTTRAINLEAI